MPISIEFNPSGTRAYDSEVAEHWLHKPDTCAPLKEPGQAEQEMQPLLAIFSYEAPDTVVGQYLRKIASGIVDWCTTIHVFVREPFDLDVPGVVTHVVGNDGGGDLMEQVEDFTRRAVNAFMREFPDCSHVTLMGFEWATIPAISLLHGIKNVGIILSIHSLERQRSNMGDELSRRIEHIELYGLRELRLILAHDAGTLELIGRCVPESADRLMLAEPTMTVEDFFFDLDPGEVKGRYQIGPIDPTILFIGDLRENYGPDLLMKAMPMVLKAQKQARCVFVGEGELLWPLRVYSRYLLLDYAVRLVGSLEGRPLRELVHAADVIVVPSRQPTPWWPIEASWAADHPVVATFEAAPALVRHEQDAVLTEAEEKSIAYGIGRVLSDPALARRIADHGRAKLEQRYGINCVVARIEQLMGRREAVEQPRELVQA